MPSLGLPASESSATAARAQVKVSNLWRVACDIQSKWDQILNRGAHTRLQPLSSRCATRTPFTTGRCVSADISDKWSPLAGPGGWNDPDMINIKNPPALALGENRVYFGRASATCLRGQTGLGPAPESSGACVGLWSIMKSPLLLSSDLPSLVPALIQMVNNTEVIAVNQDALGVQVTPRCHFHFLFLHH